jgi:hypothetical protein
MMREALIEREKRSRQTIFANLIVNMICTVEGPGFVVTGTGE